MKKSSRKIYSFFPFLAMIILIIITTSTYQLHKSYIKYTDIRSDIINSQDDEEWEIIKDIIIDEYKDINVDIKYLAKQIEVKLLYHYGDNLDSLYNDFKSGIISDGLYELLYDEIVKGSIAENKISDITSYNYILGFRDHVFASFMNSRDIIIEEFEGFIPWINYFNTDTNLELTNKLISDITNRNVDNNLLLYLTKDMGTFTNKTSLEILKEIYKTHGLNGFTNVDIINVSFITEDGDIFDNKDFINSDNYKMYLVQRSNLYHSIYERANLEISTYRSNIDSRLRIVSDITDKLVLDYIMYSSTLLIIMLVFCIVYNRHIDEDCSSTDKPLNKRY